MFRFRPPLFPLLLMMLVMPAVMLIGCTGNPALAEKNPLIEPGVLVHATPTDDDAAPDQEPQPEVEAVTATGEVLLFE